MSNWMNEAGEPYMTAAQLRFEAELDEQSAYERQYDDFYDRDDYDEGEECPDCGDYGLDTQSGECAFCGYVMAEDEGPVMEDQWLDSYMEDRMTTMFEG